MSSNKKSYISEYIDSPIGKIPKTSYRLNTCDLLGSIRARFTFNRNNYKVDPGIYAIGNPNEESVVLVSANYKLSFDSLRKNLKGIDAWILVVDTKGINVWCAAGKGTFGTDEIASRIDTTKLKELVKNYQLIVPQLGAPGVSAYKVKLKSQFSVVYGPIYAEDLPSFLKNGMKATARMRKIRFNFLDRFVLTPAEIIGSIKYLFFVMVGFLILSGINRGGYSLGLVSSKGVIAVVNLLFAYLSGAFLGPILLPLLPGRSFAVKGVFSGICVLIISYFCGYLIGNSFEVIAWMFLTLGFSSFIMMNFTGSSTYTSLSGVLKEMKIAFPLQVTCVTLGLILWIAGSFA